jgi:hypothetical protein
MCTCSLIALRSILTVRRNMDAQVPEYKPPSVPMYGRPPKDYIDNLRMLTRLRKQIAVYKSRTFPVYRSRPHPVFEHHPSITLFYV